MASATTVEVVGAWRIHRGGSAHTMGVALPFSLEDQQAADACKDDDKDGMDASEIHDTKGTDADADGNESFADFITEVLAVHQQQRSRRDEPHHHRAESHEGALDKRTLAMAVDVVAGNEREDKGRQHHGERCDQ